MISYKNISRKSGVMAYCIGDDFIDVAFPGKIYRYSYRSAGKVHVENMKRRAQAGSGLNSYIQQHVRTLYER